MPLNLGSLRLKCTRGVFILRSNYSKRFCYIVTSVLAPPQWLRNTETDKNSLIRIHHEYEDGIEKKRPKDTRFDKR